MTQRLTNPFSRPLRTRLSHLLEDAGMALLLLLLLLCATAAFAARKTESPKSKDQEFQDRLSLDVTVLAKGQTKTFYVIATKTNDEQKIALTDRDAIPDDTGTIFIAPTPVKTSISMAKVKIPLDIVFIRDYRIVKIVRGEPLDTSTIQSDEPIDAVLQVKAGQMDLIGAATENPVGY